MTLQNCINGATNPIENHSVFQYKLFQRIPSHCLHEPVRTNMLENDRRLNSSQLIPTRWGKTLSHHKYCVPAAHAQILKRMREILYTHFKSETSDLSYWFPPSSRGTSYLRKYGTDVKVLAIAYPIRYDWSMQNARRRAYKSGTSFNRQATYSKYCKRVLANSMRI